MPVTPQQALGDKLEQRQRRLDETCANIDVILKDNYRGDPVRIGYNIIDYDLVDDIIKVYNQAGWEVSRVSSGHNGLQYEFKPTLTSKMIEDYYNK